MFQRILIILLFLAVNSARAQNMMPVQFPQNPSRNTQVGMFIKDNTVYGSINDLADVFGLTVFFYPEAQKLELRSAQFTVKITSNNTFIIITDQKNNASIVQLSTNVLYAASTFFAPMDQFVPVLNYVISENIVYDRLNPTITVRGTAINSQYDVAGLMFEQKSNGFLIRIQCTKKLVDYESFLKPIGDDTWIYVTLADAKADIGAIHRLIPSGIVKQILVFQSPTSVQLTFKLKGQVNSSELVPAEGSNDILLALHTPTVEQVATRKTRDFERSLNRERSRWKLDVVVIDAGHGGGDPGTIGVGRTKEKDITLAIALKLGKIIEKQLPDVKVVYTRKTDEFVELYRRGQIANQAGAKLFISIHCNAAPRKPHPANGFEIYLLRPGKTENALRIAERENAVVEMEEGYEQRYQQLTDENFIILTMAQSAYVKYSEKFADILQQEMGRRLDIENNGVKQAGFYVLVGASMPNVLVETAYLSNKHDEKILKSSNGQQRIAESIFDGVKRYKLEYEKSLQEGKDLGAVSE